MIPGTSRLWFNRNTFSQSTVDIDHVLIAPRADHYIQLLGYRIELLIDAITYSTTTTYGMDIVLSTVSPADWGAWTLDAVASLTPPPASIVDGWRFEGGVGRVVTQGGYIIPTMARTQPYVCDLALPALRVVGRRFLGLSQALQFAGYIDYKWLKGTPAEMSAVNLAWNIQGPPHS